jgi:hypothetical protein
MQENMLENMQEKMLECMQEKVQYISKLYVKYDKVNA